MKSNGPYEVEELSESACWERLRSTSVGRLAVVVDERPDIFPLNYVVDHGTIVFRSAEGTKLTGALSDTPVAFEVDGYDARTERAWSVVVQGRATQIRQLHELADTVSLPLFPWQAGPKEIFIRIDLLAISGRRFKVAEPNIWTTPLSDARRASFE